MINTLYLPELREMLQSQDDGALREFCTALHPARTAEFMEGLTAGETWQVIQHAESEIREEIFLFVDHEKQVEIIETQKRQPVASLIALLPPDDRVDLLHDVDPHVVEALLPLLPVDERRDVLRLLEHPEGTAGAVMTTEFAKLAESLSVSEAFDELRDQAAEMETIYYIYVVDDTDHLRGVVSARQLVSGMGQPDIRLGELMETDIAAVLVDEHQEDVALKVAKFDLLAIPVVDAQRKMLGIITHDDVIDVLREEATEDAHRIAAVDPLEQSYLTIDLFTLSWKRGMWLTILFIFAFITAIALRHYESGFEMASWLLLFIPLVISSGGNTGSQSATLVITALATKDATLRDWAKIIRRELAVGLMLGIFLAVIGIGPAYLLTDGEWASIFVVCSTLILVVVCGTVLGSTLPLMFSRLGLDPALMSSPFVAGIIDILGIVIYMKVAMTMLK